jgi:hypothetical protein
MLSKPGVLGTTDHLGNSNHSCEHSGVDRFPFPTLV